MTYFRDFPVVAYNFGDNENAALFDNLTVYIDLIDKVKNNITFYNKYLIPDGERPDNTSQRLYGTPHYHWTFYLLNDSIREQGWPMSEENVRAHAKKAYPNRTVVTRDVVGDSLLIGTTAVGLSSGTIGTVLERRLDLGQLIIKTTDAYDEYTYTATNVITTFAGQARVQISEPSHNKVTGDIVNLAGVSNVGGIEGAYLTGRFTVTMADRSAGIYEIKAKKLASSNAVGGGTPTITMSRLRGNNNFGQNEVVAQGLDAATQNEHRVTLVSESVQYNSVHHYENSAGEYVSIDPYSSVPSNLIPITMQENMIRENDALRRIKVIDPNAIESVVNEFYAALR